MQTPIVGAIVALTGSATQKVAGESFQVELDGPVYKGAVLVTGAGSHLEVRFSDDTMLSQGQNSEISIDNYVFSDDPQVASSILLNLTAGTLRTITGKIAEENPEKFEIKSPLTTLGIRGTDLTLKSSPSEGDTVILNDIGTNHFLVVKDLEGGARYLNIPDTFVDIPRYQSMGRVRAIDPTLRDSLLREVPFSSSRADKAADQSQNEHSDEDYAGDSSGEGADQENIDQQVKDIQEAIASGDFSDVQDTGAGGSLPNGIFGNGEPPPFGNILHLYNPVFSQLEGYSFTKTEWSTDSDSDFLFPGSRQIEPPVVIAQVPPPTQQAQSSPEPGQPEQQLVEIFEPEKKVLPDPEYSPPQILFIGTDGDDIIIGNAANNIIYGAGGADTMYGRGGDDRFVVWGSFAPDTYQGQDEAGNDLGYGSVDDEDNPIVVSHLPDLRIDGESDYDTLIVYGDAEFTNPQTVITGIERIEIHSEVSFRPDQFTGVQDLVGIGEEDHTVIFNNPGPVKQVDLSAIDIDNINQIGIGEGVTVIVDEMTMNSLLNTDTGNINDSIVGDGKTGYGTVLTAPGIDFSDFVRAYGDEIDDNITLGRDPIAFDDIIWTSEDSSVSIKVLKNDSDPDEGDELTVVMSDDDSQPNHGTVALVDNTFTYTPNDDFNGTDSFTYTISDYTGKESSANVTVTVDPVNDAPIAENDSVSPDEGTAITIDVLDNDYDIDLSDTLAISSVTNGTSGTVTNNNGDDVTYTPNDPNWNGTDTFSYTVTDGELTDTATVTVTVVPVNDPPVAENDAVTTDEGTAINIDVLDNDYDIDLSDTLAISSVTNGTSGTVTINNGEDVTYTPNDPNWNGTDTFSYTVTDGELTDTATVTVTVAPVNDAPVAYDDSAETDEDTTSLTIKLSELLGNDTDVDGDTLSITGVSYSGEGSLVDNEDGSFTYTPEANYYGTDTFTYTVTDGGLSDTATVAITINPVDDAPVVTKIRVGDGEPVSLLNIALPYATLYGLLDIDENGIYTYTPTATSDDFTSQVILTDQINSPLTLYSFSSGKAYTTTDDQGFVFLDLSSGSDKLTYDDSEFGGIGATGGSGGDPPQLNHNAAQGVDGKTEAIAIQFDSPVESATVTVNNLSLNELGVGINESGYWEAFAEDGRLIGSGYITESDDSVVYNDEANGTASVEINVEDDNGDAIAFKTLVFTATDYMDDSGDPSPNPTGSESSDYFIHDVTWQSAEIEETVYVTLEDIYDDIGDRTDYQPSYEVPLTFVLEPGQDKSISGDVTPEISSEETDVGLTADPSPSFMLASLAEPEEESAGLPLAQTAEQQPEQTETVFARIFGDETEIDGPGVESAATEPITQIAEVDNDKKPHKIFGDDSSTDGQGPPAHAHGLAKGLTEFRDHPGQDDTSLDAIPTERIGDPGSIATSMDLTNDDSFQTLTMDDASSFDPIFLPDTDLHDVGGDHLA